VFPSLLNREMVDIDPLEEEDKEFLRAVIRKHLAETGSTVAARILNKWRREVECFVKVMPKDYKRVLEAARVAEERGIPVDEAIMAASHG
jgi:glutamate synthase (NADPH/NADH) large chain